MSNDSSRRYDIGEAVQVRYAGHWHMGAVYNRSRDDEAREWYAVNFTFDNGNTSSTLLHGDEIAARLRPMQGTACDNCGTRNPAACAKCAGDDSDDPTSMFYNWRDHLDTIEDEPQQEPQEWETCHNCTSHSYCDAHNAGAVREDCNTYESLPEAAICRNDCPEYDTHGCVPQTCASARFIEAEGWTCRRRTADATVRYLAAIIRAEVGYGRHLAAVAAVAATGSVVGIADADSAGYTPHEPLTFPRHDDAERLAAAINERAGVTREEASAVKLCSMFRPGEYDAVAPYFPSH